MRSHPSDLSPQLASRTWQTAGRIVIVPLGSTEQHGPHLPVAVDAVVAEAVAIALAERWRRGGGDAVAAPPLAYGASGEHEEFAGTISLGTAALREALVEIGRSAGRWAERIVFLNGHGGNGEALSSAVDLLRAEGRDVRWIPCAVPGSDAHAGRAETSLMLHLRPGDVRADRAEPGDTRPIREILPALRAGGVAAVAPNGVLGDPAGASADEGAALFASMCDLAWSRVHS